MKKFFLSGLTVLFMVACSSESDVPEPSPIVPNTTDGQQAVDSKEKTDYRNCTIKIESDTAAWNYEGRGLN